MGRQMAAYDEHRPPAWEAGATRMLGSAGTAASYGCWLGVREPPSLLASYRQLVPRQALPRAPNWATGHPPGWVG